MNFGDYSGDYKSNIFKVLMNHFEIDLEGLSKLTGFTESHLEGILKQENLDKQIGKRILSAMNLTNNDYDWIYIVMSEITFDRTQRIRRLEEIRFKQRQLQMERTINERVKKSNDKESSKETESSKRVKDRRGSSNKEKDNKVSVKASGGGDKGNKISESKKGDNKTFKTTESGDKNRKNIKKRSKNKGNSESVKGQKENNVQKRKGDTKQSRPIKA